MNPLLQTLRILSPGGVVPPGDLHKICQVAEENGCETIGLGSRQEIFLSVPAGKVPAALDGLVHTGLSIETEPGRKANIVTSYGAVGIYPATPWVMAGTCLDILEQFDYQPRLKINLTDPQQPLVPRFSGDLNFIASAYPDFWHLYVQLPGPGHNGQPWPVLIGSEDIARLCHIIEEGYFTDAGPGLSGLTERVARQFPALTTRPDSPAFSVPKLPFPEYEGFHGSGAGYWLGIFRRNYSYPLAFVQELCELALRSKIGKICLTPWKTLLIKDIQAGHLPHWEKLLGVHHICTRHAASELNWQVPDLDEEALNLKKRLVRELEELECNTGELSFAIGFRPMPVATSVVIEPEDPGNPVTFSIRHTADFTRSNARWRVFVRQVPVADLAGKLRELCVRYYASREYLQTELSPETALPAAKPLPAAQMPYQCTHCLTVYDPQAGDPAFGVPAGSPFGQLPDRYTCSLCEGLKKDFVLLSA